ncbi:MAG: histidine phosphatase family protein [Bacillota bacterium]
MELLIIRHGQSEADLLGRHEGRADFSLTDLGVKQAELLSNWILEKFPPDYILSSTLKRAVMTSEIISEKTGVRVDYDDNLMEFNNGLLAGLTFEEAKVKYPIPIEGKKPHQRYYEQETLIEFRARAEAVLSRVMHEYPPDKRVIIVSHGGMINMLFKSFMQLPMNTEYGIYNGDTAVHLWVINGSNRYIGFMNSREHLLLLD